MTWILFQVARPYQFYNIFLKAIDFNKNILKFQAGTVENDVDIVTCHRLILVICQKSYIPQNGYILVLSIS